MSAYSVKPAVFDLFLGLVIAAYLAAIYLLVQVSCHKVYKNNQITFNAAELLFCMGFIVSQKYMCLKSIYNKVILQYAHTQALRFQLI
jgi:hypothetical protein